VIGREVRIGNNVRVGGTDIACEEVLLEDEVVIGDGVSVRCKRFVMRRGSRIDNRVVIYGNATARSSIELGEHAWVFSDCIINPDDSISVGARTAVGNHGCLFTHSSYLPVTHGYPVTVAPIQIGEDVWLPWQVFVMPGATIGRGATVGAYSLVRGNIPEDSLAVGVPARVVRDAQSYRRRYSSEEMVHLCEEVIQCVVDSTVHGFRPSTLFFPNRRSVVLREVGCWEVSDSADFVRIVLVPRVGERVAAYLSTPAQTVFLTAGAVRPPADGCNWCDLVSQASSLPLPVSPLLREVMASFTRYGIRFAWYSEASAG
jgi:acetyltransferase-like isoleucine patch superfamily enzyme